MKATEQYFPVVLFIILYKVVLTFESVDEILKCDYSNESYWAVLSCGSVWIRGWNPLKGLTIQMKAIEQYLLVVLYSDSVEWNPKLWSWFQKNGFSPALERFQMKKEKLLEFTPPL